MKELIILPIVAIVTIFTIVNIKYRCELLVWCHCFNWSVTKWQSVLFGTQYVICMNVEKNEINK